MKSIFYLFIIVVIIGSSISIIYKTIKKDDYQKSTTAVLKNKIIDVGDRKIKSNVEGYFTIVNSGKSDLIIKSVEPDCHCTVSSFNKKPVSPQDSAKIMLKFDSSNLGVFQSSAVVKTNSINNPQMILILRGNIIP